MLMTLVAVQFDDELSAADDHDNGINYHDDCNDYNDLDGYNHRHHYDNGGNDIINDVEVYDDDVWSDDLIRW